jgi:glucans biosynthesis protein C
MSSQSEPIAQTNIEAVEAVEAVEVNTMMSETQPEKASRVRLFFADHLRVALTILVVLHHLAVIYGANAAFYYVEPPSSKDLVAFVLLLVFVLINQAYFMGFFFLLSGYFTPGSFERKRSAAFLKDRLLRLGIPLLVFIFILSPLSFVGVFEMPVALTHLTTPFTWQMYPLALGVGPLWFAEMLLIFDFGYVGWQWGWQWLTRNRTWNWQWEISVPGYPTIGLFILVLAGTSYLLRIVVPMGMTIPILGFPTFSYFPQYLSFFILGIIALRNDWFRTIPGSMGKVGFGVALLATILLFPLALSGKTAFLGHGTWQSAAYALWDSTFSVGMCLALITFFRRFFNRQSRLGRFLSQQAFTVYIIHIPVIIFLALALRGLHPEQLLKFALAALIGVPLCFGIAYLVRKIPFASRVL